jgi:hypothetical protein
MGKCEDKGKDLQEEGDGDDGGEKEGGGRKEGDETAGEGRYKYLNKLDRSKCSSHRRSIGPASSRPPPSNLEERCEVPLLYVPFPSSDATSASDHRSTVETCQEKRVMLVLTATMSMYRILG